MQAVFVRHLTFELPGHWGRRCHLKVRVEGDHEPLNLLNESRAKEAEDPTKVSG